MHDIVGELSVRGRNFQPNVTWKKKEEKRILYPPAREGLKCFNLQYTSQLAVLPTSRKGGAALCCYKVMWSTAPFGILCGSLSVFVLCVMGIWLARLGRMIEACVFHAMMLEALLPGRQQKLWLLKSTPPARQNCTASAAITSFSIKVRQDPSNRNLLRYLYYIYFAMNALTLPTTF